jgi:glycosyltransferase involved in cell wall biosynthesis
VNSGSDRRREPYRIVFLGGTAGDWGGASRVLFNSLRMLDRSVFEPIVLLPRVGPAIPLLDELSIRYRIWPGPSDAMPAWRRYGTGLAGSVRMLLGLRADLLDVNLNFWRPPEVLAARLLGIPVVNHFHLVFRRADIFIRLAAAVTTVSEFAASNGSFAGRRVVVIPNTVVPERFDRATSLREELGLAASDVVVSFIGQIRESKGIGAYLRMAGSLNQPNLRFLVVGECRDRSVIADAYDVARLQREIGTDTRIRYLGYRQDVERVYRTSDIVVVPSCWGEPFGLVTIEAGAAGVPVVATRDGGMPEVIRDGENGLLVEVGDDSGLAAAVARLVASPGLRAEMGQRARQIVEAEYTVAPVRRLERLYLELLQR